MLIKTQFYGILFAFYLFCNPVEEFLWTVSPSGGKISDLSPDTKIGSTGEKGDLILPSLSS